MQNKINKSSKIALVYFMLMPLANLFAQDNKGFTLEESRSYHHQFSKDIFNGWGGGGRLTRYVFLHFSEFWPHSVINRAGAVKELPLAPREDVANFITKTQLGELSLRKYVSKAAVDGVVIIHKGQIIFEDYPRMLPSDKHIYFSVSKVLVSTAIAILEDRGQIDVSKTIDFFFPKLKESDWKGVQVIDILDMASGMDCKTEFGGPNNCFQKSFYAYGWPSVENALADPMDYFATIPSIRPPGQIFEYVNVNTLMLTLLVERISGLTFADFMEQEIWQPMGAEADALMLSAAYGRAATSLGVNSALRDMARFGLSFTPTGRKGQNPLISDAYLRKIQQGGRPELFRQSDFGDKFKDGSLSHNTYQWDHVAKDGDFYKSGHGGQGLYISPRRDLVIAYFGTYGEDKIWNEMHLINRQLAKSGLFDE